MNYTKMIIFFTVVLIIFGLLDFFVISRWRKYCISKGYNKNSYRIPIYVSGVMMIIFAYANYYNFLVYPVPSSVKALNILTSFWYLPKILIIPFLTLIEVYKPLKKISVRKFKKAKLDIPAKVIKSRRHFMGNVAWSVAGIPYLLAVKGLVFTINELKIFRESIYFHKLPAALDGLKIVQISDLHLGTFMTPEPLNRLKSLVNSLNPDLIFITGDFVNFRYEELDAGEELLRGLKSNYGTFACLGNHDHYMTDIDHQKLIKRINNTGVQLLINENRVLNIRGKEINLASIDNYGSKQTYGDFNKAFEGLSDDNVTIFLSHDPKTWDSHIVGKRNVDLTLSGHTHGGQVALEFMGYDLSLAKVMYKQYKGLYSSGNQYLYVNSGIGVSGPPIRLGINPEVTLITLKKPMNLAKV
ncbi:MAG: metallophosphoesterase [Candidatus Kapabacteria bacterium]|nr:metallophosphoesterase [Candidatus Kapabacteria bacterium]